MKKIKSKVFLLICLGLILTACDVFTPKSETTPAPTPVVDPGVLAEGNLVPAEETVLVFAIPGRVGEILAAEGDVVQAGDELAKLDDVEPFEAQVASAKLALLQAEQDLDDLNEQASLVAARAKVELVLARREVVDAERAWDEVDNEDYREELDDARIDRDEAEEELEEAEEDLADYEDLDEDNPTREAAEDDLEQAQQDYDEAVWVFKALQNRFDLTKARLALAQEALEDAERRAEETTDGPSPDDLALAEASLKQAEAQLAAAEVGLEDTVLVAPFDGRILRLELTEGEQISPGSMTMVLADTSEWYLETNDLTEDEVVRINSDESVSVCFDAFPEETFPGEIVSISEYFVEQFGDITYVVRIRLLESDERLRWGMTAEVTFVE